MREVRKPHVAVIGGGVTGAITALTLAEDGYPVVVLEKAAVGNGASSRSAAAIRQQFSTPVTVRGMRFATEYYRKFAACYDCESMHFQRGYLVLYRDADALDKARTRQKIQHDCGLTEAVILTPEQTVRQFPYVQAAELAGATWCPTDGFLTPDVIYQTAFTRARVLGAQMRQNTPVTGVVRSGNCITALMTPHGNVAADIVINATGIWTPRNVVEVLQCSQIPITPMKVYLYFRDMRGVEMSDWPFIVTQSGAYCRTERPHQSERLLMGWITNRSSQKTLLFEDDFQD
mgnify:CR=1 FL=1